MQQRSKMSIIVIKLQANVLKVVQILWTVSIWLKEKKFFLWTKERLYSKIPSPPLLTRISPISQRWWINFIIFKVIT